MRATDWGYRTGSKLLVRYLTFPPTRQLGSGLLSLPKTPGRSFPRCHEPSTHNSHAAIRVGGPPIDAKSLVGRSPVMPSLRASCDDPSVVLISEHEQRFGPVADEARTVHHGQRGGSEICQASDRGSSPGSQA